MQSAIRFRGTDIGKCVEWKEARSMWCREGKGFTHVVHWASGAGYAVIEGGRVPGWSEQLGMGSLLGKVVGATKRSSVYASTIFKIIDESRYILELKDDWDGEGGEPYDRSTWEAACNFVKGHEDWVWNILGLWVSKLQVLHGPKGSIDVHWRAKDYDLLVNIPPVNEMASFYGDDYGKMKIRGTFNFRSDRSPFEMVALQKSLRLMESGYREVLEALSVSDVICGK